MKKIVYIICLMLSVVSCNNNAAKKPDNLIDEDKMVDVLYDVSLLEAIKMQNINGGINGKTENEYIYKKYNIDSTQFVESNKYYASNLEAYKAICEKVKVRLDKEKERVESEMKKNGEQIPPKRINAYNSQIPPIER